MLHCQWRTFLRHNNVEQTKKSTVWPTTTTTLDLLKEVEYEKNMESLKPMTNENYPKLSGFYCPLPYQGQEVRFIQMFFLSHLKFRFVWNTDSHQGCIKVTYNRFTPWHASLLIMFKGFGKKEKKKISHWNKSSIRLYKISDSQPGCREIFILYFSTLTSK